MKKMLIILAALMLLTGCNDNTPEPSQAPVYNSPMVSAGVSFAPDATTSAEPSADAAELSYENPEYFTNFAGVAITEETPKSANSPFTNIYAININNKAYIITCDEESGTVYYANYGRDADVYIRDGYIYSYKDGERELLVEMPANYLNYKDGVIYFISNDSIPNLYGLNGFDVYYPSGKLYAYDIIEDKVSLLLDRNVSELSVIGDYLYFREAIADENVHRGVRAAGEYSRLRIGESTAEGMGAYLPFFYGEYQLRLSNPEEGSALCTIELVSEDKAITLTGAGFYNAYWGGAEFCVAGDMFWFKGKFGDEWKIGSINLASGEQKVYPYAAHFVVNDDNELVVIFSDGTFDSNIRIYNEDTGEYEPIIEEFAHRTLVHELYYAGGELYLAADDSISKLVPVDGEENTYDAEEISG